MCQYNKWHVSWWSTILWTASSIIMTIGIIIITELSRNDVVEGPPLSNDPLQYRREFGKARGLILRCDQAIHQLFISKWSSSVGRSWLWCCNTRSSVNCTQSGRDELTWVYSGKLIQGENLYGIYKAALSHEGILTYREYTSRTRRGSITWTWGLWWTQPPRQYSHRLHCLRFSGALEL